MKLFRRLRTRFWKLLKPRGQERFYTLNKGRVDAGREAFVQLSSKEKSQKKTLLRKLNRYWSQKKTTSPQLYNTAEKTFNWRRASLLVVCLGSAVGLFVIGDGAANVVSLLTNLDYFKVTNIEVKGCVRSSAEHVRSSSGIQVNASQYSIDSEKAVKAIQAANSWISDVNIARRWPDGLLIEIGEFEPQAMIAIEADKNAQLHYLDGKGEPFIQVVAGMDLDFPVITGLEQGDSSSRLERLKDSLYFLRLIGANNPNLPAQSVSEIHVDQQEGLVVHLVEYPFPIFFGSGEVREKYIKLRKVLEVLYKPRKTGMEIARVTYIRMDYLNDKVIVGYSESG